MDKLTIFYLKGCPYCRSAVRAAKKLEASLPGFSADRIEWIDEQRNADLAARYDYYYVPSVFFGEKKLYECSPSDDEDTIGRHLRDAVKTAFGL